MRDLDSILKGSEEPNEPTTQDPPVSEPDPVTEPPPEPEATTGEPPVTQEPNEPKPTTAAQQPRDERGKFAPKNDQGTAAPPAAKQDASHIPIQALLDEREKRQRLERELEEIRRTTQQRQPAEQPKKPDFYENPEAYLQHMEQVVEERVTLARLNMAEANARARHQDFDAALQEFEGLVRANPALYQHMLAQPDPAEFAYQLAKRHQRMREIGDDPDGWARRRAQELLDQDEAFRGEVLQKYAPAPQPQSPAPSIPQSLATARNTGSRSAAPAWTGPKPLSDILKR